ncbi:MAG: hypothetical protein QOI82_1826 [Actinomycetota bacterium]|nr:hypothetical protein [Actinomycetota bacterium]
MLAIDVGLLSVSLRRLPVGRGALQVAGLLTILSALVAFTGRIVTIAGVAITVGAPRRTLRGAFVAAVA